MTLEAAGNIPKKELKTLWVLDCKASTRLHDFRPYIQAYFARSGYIARKDRMDEDSTFGEVDLRCAGSMPRNRTSWIHKMAYAPGEDVQRAFLASQARDCIFCPQGRFQKRAYRDLFYKDEDSHCSSCKTTKENECCMYCTLSIRAERLIPQVPNESKVVIWSFPRFIDGHVQLATLSAFVWQFISLNGRLQFCLASLEILVKAFGVYVRRSVYL